MFKFSSQGISLCFTAVKITKTSQETSSFGVLGIPSWNIRSFLSLRQETSISENISSFFRVGFFHFSSSESYFLKYKNFFRVSISWNIKRFRFLKYKEFFRGFHFLKYKKSFLLRTYKKFVKIRARKFHFPKYKKI